MALQSDPDCDAQAAANQQQHTYTATEHSRSDPFNVTGRRVNGRSRQYGRSLVIKSMPRPTHSEPETTPTQRLALVQRRCPTTRRGAATPLSLIPASRLQHTGWWTTVFSAFFWTASRFRIWKDYSNIEPSFASRKSTEQLDATGSMESPPVFFLYCCTTPLRRRVALRQLLFQDLDAA